MEWNTNPQMSQRKPHYQMSEEERRQSEVQAQLAVNRLNRLDHHVPPVVGEHCYFKTSRPQRMEIAGFRPCARYICHTTQGESRGVDFSVTEGIDTYGSPFNYQGKLVEIEFDHGHGPLYMEHHSFTRRRLSIEEQLIPNAQG